MHKVQVWFLVRKQRSHMPRGQKKKKKKKNTSGIETLYDLSVHLQGLQPKNSSFRLILFYPQMSCFCIGLNQGTNWDACELGRL